MRMDLNADLGESFGAWSMGDDAAMLDVVSSANIACGFHAGDPLTMRHTVALAAERGVRIGAHVSYRDRVGFGRRFIDVAPAELAAEILYQVGALEAVCRAAGTRVAYVKPHGALYNTIVHHQAQAAAVVSAILDYDPSLPLMGLPGGIAERLAARAGLPTIAEAFADRGYTASGALVPRGEPGAVLDDPAEVAARMVELVTTGLVTGSDGSRVRIDAQSICVHGDTPGAVALARAVRRALADAGVTVAPFAP